MSKHRKPSKIMADMLSIVEFHTKKTRIMYGANMSYTLLIKYLNDAIRCNLIKDNDGKGFELTDKGREYLKHYRDYISLQNQTNKQLEIRKNKLKEFYS
ncbi:MAG: winged helix-turn-helix domain-containing protein [Candidatus Hodarchaeota archaeon]